MNIPPLDTEENMDWYRRMLHAYEHLLTDEEKTSLHSWEQENLDGENVSTSDWPGWQKYIGPPPWKWRSN